MTVGLAQVLSACVLIGVGTASRSQSSTDITVTKPVGLKFGLQGSTSLEHQSATFGTPDLLGEFSHAEQKMKLYETNSQDSNLCPTFSRDMGSKGILLIDGYYDCPYTKLAREAQEAGMVGVVVAEKSYACTLGKYPEWYKKQAEGRHGCKDTLPHMTGKFASDITIPAVIISRLDAERLKDCFKQVVNKANKTTDVECTAVPELEMKWNLNPHDKVSWELWTSSLLNRDVFADSYFYKMVLPRLQNISTFQPRFFVWNGTELGCRDSKKCGDACHNKNRYCHMDPDGLNTGDYSGIRMSQENMRQYCVFKTNSEQIKWWKYISLIAEKCSRAANGRRPFDVDCSKECHADAGLNFDATMKCITDNGGYGVDDDRKNSAWEEELRDRNEIDLQRLPTITVNGRIIEAELTLKIVLEAICGGFIRKKRPELCQCVSRSADDITLRRECFDAPPPPITPPSSGGVGTGTFFMVLVLLAGGLVLAFYLVRLRDRTRMRQEFHEDVRNIMSEYMRMDGEDDGSFLGNSIGSEDVGINLVNR